MTSAPKEPKAPPIPDRYRRVTPSLIVDGAAKALDFYAEVFPRLPPEVKRSIRGFVVSLSRALVGDWVCDLVGLPQSYALEELFAPHAIELIDAIAKGVLLQTGLYKGKRFGGVKPYEIPRSLKGAFA